jgi:hypothetical protein
MSIIGNFLFLHCDQQNSTNCLKLIKSDEQMALINFP